MQNQVSGLIWRGFRWLTGRAVSPLTRNQPSKTIRSASGTMNPVLDGLRSRLNKAHPRGPIAVVLSLWQFDVWEDISRSIGTIEQNFDLFVALRASSEHLGEAIRRSYPFACLFVLDDGCEDFLQQLIHTGRLFDYELICVLGGDRGSAQSRNRSNGSPNIGVLGSRVTRQVVDAYHSNTDLGIVVSGELLGRDGFSRGTGFWIRPFLLRSLGALGPRVKNSDPPFSPRIEHVLARVCQDAGMVVAKTEMLPPPTSEPAIKVHVIANYLPQFHPIPENDTWWEPGFTEWINVVRAKPQFSGHLQPRLPADLGFYDLRLAEVRNAQARLAAKYGITAFSYYYYWFNGRKLLSRPLEEVLASGQPDFPFMLCWANEPWTRRWDGFTNEVLLAQTYAAGWETALAADLAPVLSDPRYLRLNGSPVLAIYRVMHIPDPKGAIQCLRAGLAKRGISSVHIIAGNVQFDGDPMLPRRPHDLGLDAHFEFPPHGIFGKCLWKGPLPGKSANFTGFVNDYSAVVDAVVSGLSKVSEPRYRAAMTAWDNTARRGASAWLFHGATPGNFRRWLRATVVQARLEAWAPETAVFINAWNEWAEGAYLEPDRDFGRGWLEAVASATAT